MSTHYLYSIIIEEGVKWEIYCLLRCDCEAKKNHGYHFVLLFPPHQTQFREKAFAFYDLFVRYLFGYLWFCSHFEALSE